MEDVVELKNNFIISITIYYIHSYKNGKKKKVYIRIQIVCVY